MGKPWQVKCQVPGCTAGWTNADGEDQEGPYYTDPDCSSVTERSQDQKDHVTINHEHEKTMMEARAKEITAEAAKLTAEAEKLRAEGAAGGGQAVKGERKAMMARPTVEENVTESDWSYFLAEWERYCDATGLKQDAQGAVCHLWQACSDGLR